jgi:hypothetical protein
MSRIYISGPMRGYKHFNFDAFRQCEDYLTTCRFASTGGRQIIFNPARYDAEVIGLGWEPDETMDLSQEDIQNWMRKDLTEVAAADHIVLLPGWRESTGARREYAVARWCGVTAWEYNPASPTAFRMKRVMGDVDAQSVVSMSGGMDSTATVSAVIERTDLAQQDFDRKVGPHSPDFDFGDQFPVDFDWPETATCGSGGTGEVRSVNALTGGEKGVKPARFDLLPVGPLTQVATHYGIGAEKYEDRNWEKGYEWSKSFAAMQRHAWAFWGGEDIDPETGSPHLAAVVFHALAMLEWASTHPELDDRVKPEPMTVREAWDRARASL